MAPDLGPWTGRDARQGRLRTVVLPLGFAVLGSMVAVAAFVVMARADLGWPKIAGEELVGLSYIVAGTIAWLRRPGNRIGPAILGAGITWFVPVFVMVPVAAIAASTFAFAWVTNLFVVFILLAYPTGHLFSAAARVVFWVAVIGTVIPVAARLFLLDAGVEFSSATGPSALRYGCDCPNPFALFPDDRLYGAAMLSARLLAIVVTITVLILIIDRWRRASQASRRRLVPVLFAGAVGLAAFAIDEIAFTAGGEQPILALTTVGLVFARAAVPVGFLLGLLRTEIDRLLVGRLVAELGGAPSPERIEALVAVTLHDSSARVGFWSPVAETYLDPAGHRIEAEAPAGRVVTLVEREGERLCAIDFDAALAEDPQLVSAVVAALRLSVDRDRLEAMVRAQAGESHSLPRGPVTLLYADIEGSTSLLDRLGSRYGDLLAETRRIERAVVREHGGREVDSRADEFFAVFPAGTAPADAALAIDRRFRDLAWPEGVVVRIRIGLHRGEPELGDEGYVGMDVHMAARLGAAGHGGQILVSASAREAIDPNLPSDARLRDLGAYELRGIPGRHEIMQLVVPDLPSEFPPLRLGAASPR